MFDSIDWNDRISLFSFLVLIFFSHSQICLMRFSSKEERERKRSSYLQNIEEKNLFFFIVFLQKKNRYLENLWYGLSLIFEKSKEKSSNYWFSHWKKKARGLVFQNYSKKILIWSSIIDSKKKIIKYTWKEKRCLNRFIPIKDKREKSE